MSLTNYYCRRSLCHSLMRSEFHSTTDEPQRTLSHSQRDAKSLRHFALPLRPLRLKKTISDKIVKECDATED